MYIFIDEYLISLGKEVNNRINLISPKGFSRSLNKDYLRFGLNQFPQIQ
jgi:hypothetical protein